jgi:hypothetical protein
MGLAALSGEHLNYPTHVASLRLTTVGTTEALDNGLLRYKKSNPQT